MTHDEWNSLRWFRQREFLCACCGVERMALDFMRKLDDLRDALGFPLLVTSGWRCQAHNSKIGGSLYGPHTQGRAADILIELEPAYRLVSNALRMGFTGIGMYQKGTGPRYVHLDIAAAPIQRPRIWTY